MGDTQVFRWLLNVGNIWQAANAGSYGPSSTAQWATGPDVKKALDLLPAHERAKVLRFYRVQDAKLCLGSNLLKHKAISGTCNVAWKDSVLSEDSNRKPCFKPTNPDQPSIEFNVSHHGTLVALVGCPRESTKLGVDIVQVNWEKDYPMVVKSGFEKWANIYEMVFSDREIADIVNYHDPGSRTSQVDIRVKLRHFYAHWCLKEAYIKMNGEALLAPWLKELEFRNVKVPLPASQEAATGEQWGQLLRNEVEIWLRGARVVDVQMELQAYGEDYMIGTAVSTPNVVLSNFQDLAVAKDIYSTAGAA